MTHRRYNRMIIIIRAQPYFNAAYISQTAH